MTLPIWNLCSKTLASINYLNFLRLTYDWINLIAFFFFAYKAALLARVRALLPDDVVGPVDDILHGLGLGRIDPIPT